MRIVRLDAFTVRYPIANPPFVLSGGKEFTTLDGTILKIYTDDGVTGWGEQTPLPGYMIAHAEGTLAALKILAPALLGMDPRALKCVQQRMRAVLKGHLYARSMIDTACWDILGKSANLPLSNLLGGTFQQRFPLVRAIGIDEPARMQARAEELMAEGYSRIQVKVGNDWRSDLHRARSCLAKLHPADIVIIDANGNWRQDEAIQFISGLDAGVYIEQPCRTMEECFSVRRRTGCLLILDESLARSRTTLVNLAHHGIDGAMLKLSRFGGITPVRQVRDWCEELGIPVIVEDGGVGDIVSAVSAHFAASTQPSLLLSGSLTNVLAGDHVFADAPRHKNGYGTVPANPGLGLGDPNRSLGSPVLSFKE